MNRQVLIEELKKIWRESEIKMIEDGFTDAAYEIETAINVLERTYTDGEKYGVT